MAEGGNIIIRPKLVTDKFDRQIKKFEDELKKEEENAEIKLKVKEGAEQDLIKHQKEVARLKEEYDKLAPTAQEYYDIVDKINSEQKISSADYNKAIGIENTTIISDYEKIKSQLESMEIKEDRLKIKVEQKAHAYQRVLDRVSQIKQNIENTKLQQQVAEVDKLKQSFTGLSVPIQDAIGKVARLALGIFGIRSAYMLVRRASSDLASYDQQYATNLEYIRFALANAIAPILKWIVSATATILHYIGIILNALFGINIFSNSSAKAFTNMKKGASGVSKAVGEIKKQLAGFDEMNVLQDNGNVASGGGGGGIGGVATPDFDFSDLDRPIPKWLEWLTKHKEEILSLLAGIAGYIIAIKTRLEPIKALGIGVLITGVVLSLQKLIDYLKDPTWESFGGIIEGIGIAIVGLGILIGSVPVAVAGAITIITGLIVKNWKKIKTFLQNGINWLTEKSDLIHKLFGDVIGNIYDTFVNTLQILLNFFDNIFKDIRGIFDGLIMFLKGIFTNDWEMVWNGLKTIFVNILSSIKDFFIMIFGILENIINTVVDTIISLSKGLWNTVINLLKDLLNWFGQILNNIINGVVRIGEKIGSVIQNVLNWFGQFINNIIDGVSTLKNKISDIIKTILTFIKEKINDAKTFFGNAIELIIRNVRNACENIISFFKNAWVGVKEIFKDTSTFFGTVFTNAFNAIKNAFGNIKNFFTNIWKDIKNIFSNMGSSVGDAISGSFKNVINTVLKKAESVLNSPISAINSLLNNINEIPRH